VRNFPYARIHAAITRNAVAGGCASLVDQIQDVIEGGDFDWLGFDFPDYFEDLRVFAHDVLPKLLARRAVWLTRRLSRGEWHRRATIVRLAA
jgi:hypothetical protein